MKILNAPIAKSKQKQHIRSSKKGKMFVAGNLPDQEEAKEASVEDRALALAKKLEAFAAAMRKNPFSESESVLTSIKKDMLDLDRAHGKFMQQL